MKKYICTLIFAITTTLVVQAQNANRSGVFLEIGPTSPLKKVIITDCGVYDDYKMHYLSFDISTGYRFTTSRHWAFDIKLNTLTDMCSTDVSGLLAISLMSGIRYTSYEFYKNISFYTSLNLGGGYRICKEEYENSVNAALQRYYFEFGFNFTAKSYLGATINYNRMKKIIYDRGYLDVGKFCNIIMVGVKYGYRF